MPEKRTQNPFEDLDHQEASGQRTAPPDEELPQYTPPSDARHAPLQGKIRETPTPASEASRELEPSGPSGHNSPQPPSQGGYYPPGEPYPPQQQPQYGYPPPGPQYPQQGAPQYGQYGPAQGEPYPPQQGPPYGYPPGPGGYPHQDGMQQYGGYPPAGPGDMYPPQGGMPGMMPGMMPVDPSMLNPNRPVAIPQVGMEKESPFLRAYAPYLMKYRVPKEMFLAFLDKLNAAMKSSPPMQVLDLTGGVLQSVPILFPLHWLGSIVSGAANKGSQGLTKSRADSVVKQANKEMFGPLGLKVEIARLKALARVAKIPILDSDGRVNTKAPVIQQLGEFTLHGTEVEDEANFQRQRVELFRPWIADLEIDSDNPLKKNKSRLTRYNKSVKNYYEGARDLAKTDPDLYKSLWLVIREIDSTNPN
ncbi:uncharacterized protein N7483_003748 [Penicillium malachiteum]|uniref:uncharacterized protein n=1 Tax=Penicillium malachiteum TaxID=1324776 RepID=UPI002547B6D6|nr:uncharacterized protein N7483_003748 [Penicillium malachiteum]KAJ5729240.1 hypothetical protein N7483_003748 [Penicillium malachiteum]